MNIVNCRHKMTVVQHSSIAAVTSAADAPSRLCHYAVAMEILSLIHI